MHHLGQNISELVPRILLFVCLWTPCRESLPIPMAHLCGLALGGVRILLRVWEETWPDIWPCRWIFVCLRHVEVFPFLLWPLNLHGSLLKSFCVRLWRMKETSLHLNLNLSLFSLIFFLGIISRVLVGYRHDSWQLLRMKPPFQWWGHHQQLHIHPKGLQCIVWICAGNILQLALFKKAFWGTSNHFEAPMLIGTLYLRRKY